MEKTRIIEVTVCAGTTCHVMGGSELMLLPQALAERGLTFVTVKGVPCLGECKDHQHGQAPYVSVDGEIMAQATVNKIIEKLLAIRQEVPDGR